MAFASAVHVHIDCMALAYRICLYTKSECRRQGSMEYCHTSLETTAPASTVFAHGCGLRALGNVKVTVPLTTPSPFVLTWR